MPKVSIQPQMGVQLTLRQTLLMIAAIGVSLGAFRYHFSLGSFVTGVLALTALRTRQVINGFRERGFPLTRRCLADLVCKSFCVSVILLGGSFAPGFLVLCLSGDGWSSRSLTVDPFL